MHRDIGEYQQASIYLTEAIDYFAKTKRITRLAESYLALGKLLIMQNDLESALDMVKKSMVFAHESNKMIVIF